MGDKSYGQMLVEGFVRAIPWAIVFSAAFVVTTGLVMAMAKQEVKEAMDFGGKLVARKAMTMVLHDPTFNREILPKVKQAAKETIDYTAMVAAQKMGAKGEKKSGGR